MTDAPALVIDQLKFRYGSKEPWVVDIAALELDPSEQMLLTGGSGRGKSTLLQLIAGLLDPTSGAVKIDGKVIHGLSGAARDHFRGAHVGMIFQTFNLLHGFSAVENVLAALMFSDVPKGEHRSRANELLSGLGIEHPRRRVETYSIGQQQRVAVARAVACQPRLVLADEPTASLDPENAAAALDLIQETCRANDAALLLTSHDPSLVDRFERRESLETLNTPAEGVS